MVRSVYICPVCKKKGFELPLFSNDKVLKCENNHSFDISREGYVNLDICASHTKSSGDNKEMCVARKKFLEKDYYYPFAKEISRVLKEHISKDALVIDAGCGEGYYLRNMEDTNFTLTGIDLAVNSVKLASKCQKARQRDIHYAVSGIFDMPYSSGSADAVISVFAPVGAMEAHRVLKKEGILAVCGAGEKHLYELKSAIYDNPYENSDKDTQYEGFEKYKECKVSYTFSPDSESLFHLYMMTPYSHRTSESDREKLKNIESIEITADFFIKLYKNI